MSTAYSTAAIGQTELGDRAIEFPEAAINDCILNAGDRMVSLIGLDRYSPYRNYFAGVTSNVATGAVVPILSSTSKSRIGVIGDVLDASTSKKCVAKEYAQVVAIPIASPPLTLRQSPHWYYTDNVRIWHTRTNVVIDIVVWDKSDQRSLMTSTPNRGDCPFPQDLHEALICGALSYLFRGSFNNDQVVAWRKYFNETLERLGQNLSKEEVQERKMLE